MKKEIVDGENDIMKLCDFADVNLSLLEVPVDKFQSKDNITAHYNNCKNMFMTMSRLLSDANTVQTKIIHYMSDLSQQSDKMGKDLVKDKSEKSEKFDKSGKPGKSDKSGKQDSASDSDNGGNLENDSEKEDEEDEDIEETPKPKPTLKPKVIPKKVTTPLNTPKPKPKVVPPKAEVAVEVKAPAKKKK